MRFSPVVLVIEFVLLRPEGNESFRTGDPSRPDDVLGIGLCSVFGITIGGFGEIGNSVSPAEVAELRWLLGMRGESLERSDLGEDMFGGSRSTDGGDNGLLPYSPLDERPEKIFSVVELICDPESSSS